MARINTKKLVKIREISGQKKVELVGKEKSRISGDKVITD